MGNFVHRKTDITTGHGCWPPQTPSSWSPDTFVNNLNVIRMNDGRVPHTCPPIPETHGATYVDASCKTFVNNQPIQVKGSPLSCGDHANTVSGDTWAG
jgi:uncharacterized Zn-binding protein involved in type VI secretion